MKTEWEEVRIDEIGKVVTGNTPSKKNSSFFGGKYPWIKPTDIRISHRHVSKTEETYSESAFRKYKKCLLPPLSTCVVTIGTVGEKICLTKEPSFTNQSINAVIPKEGKYDPMFVYYLLKHNLPKVAKRNPGTASGRHHVSKSNFSSMVVSLPPYPMQERISAILSPFDDLIEANERKIEILEKISRLIYLEWFVHFRYPRHENEEPIKGSHQLTPNGWEMKKLGELADEVRVNISPENTDPETPYVGLAHLPRKSIALSEWGIISETKSTKLVFERNDVLFAKIRPYLHKVAVAPLGGACSSDTIIIRPKKKRDYSLVLMCVSSEPFVAFADRTSKGTQMPRTDWEILRNYDVPYPPSKLLDRFNSFIKENVRLTQNLVFRNKVLIGIRDLLLPKLISDELDVS